MTSWIDKASVNDVLKFCESWKTREQIMARFEMTSIQSWHCVRYLSKLHSSVETLTGKGWTGRAHEFRTREHEIKKIKEEMQQNSQ